MIPQEIKLLNLLSNNDVTFFIPPYQRNYEWTKEQCEVFLNDVVKTCEKNTNGNNEEHFFGSITYFENETPPWQPDRLVLIDGQQRITTTMLFLAALRDTLDDTEIKDYINLKYLKNENAKGEGEYKIKLKQVETDWQTYKKIVLAQRVTEKEKDADVYKNYMYFCSSLKKLKGNGLSLESLINKGVGKFSVVTIELEPSRNKWENPQEIFESMNSLGKPLSLADLVRNYLLLGFDAETQTELYNQYWLHIEKAVPKRTSDFIRDYMQGVKGTSYLKATEKNYKSLYGTFKNIFDGHNVKSLLQNLSEHAEIYSYIIANNTCGNTQIDRLLNDLRALGITTSYSFLMILLNEWKQGAFTDEDIVDILEAFRTYCIRRRIISLAQGENKFFPTFVSRIDELKKSNNKKDTMFRILADYSYPLRMPNDEELTREMCVMNFYNDNCKYFLSLIEESLTRGMPDQNDKRLQVEHIMPQTLDVTKGNRYQQQCVKAWQAELGDDYNEVHREFVNNIGNLTLIRHNPELGQKPFTEKKEVYEEHAGLQIARTKITDNDKWNKDAIERRRDWIIKYLLNKVLPIPADMKKANNYSVERKRQRQKNSAWIFPCTADVMDNDLAPKFRNDLQIAWEGGSWKPQVDDIVFLYVSSPHRKRIEWVCFVTEIVNEEDTKLVWVQKWFSTPTETDELSLNALKLHGLKGNLRYLRKVPNEVLEYIAEIVNKYDNWDEYEDDVDIRETERRGPFRFSEYGILPGSELEFIEDSSIRPIVVDDRKIEYNGEITSLSALAQKLKGFDYGVQGTLWFKYNGEILDDLRTRMESEYESGFEDEEDEPTEIEDCGGMEMYALK